MLFQLQIQIAKCLWRDKAPFSKARAFFLYNGNSKLYNNFILLHKVINNSENIVLTKWRCFLFENEYKK
jgi:hypothetical protein